MENVTNTTTPMTNASNITTVDNSTNFENETVHENQTNYLDESSGMIVPETPATPSEPTKKPTEKRSTEIIDILIGSRRRRARVSQRCFEISCN